MSREWTDDLNSVTRLWILLLPISHPDVADASQTPRRRLADAFCCKPPAKIKTPHSLDDGNCDVSAAISSSA